MAYELNPGLSDPNSALMKGPDGPRGPNGKDGTPGKDGADFNGPVTDYNVPSLQGNTAYDRQINRTGHTNGVAWWVSETTVTQGIFSAVSVNVMMSLDKLNTAVNDAVFYQLQKAPLAAMTKTDGDRTFHLSKTGALSYTCPAASVDDINAKGLNVSFSYFTHD